FRERRQDYKIDQITKLDEEVQDGTVSIYQHGGFVDLCRGPHVERTGKIGPFRLLSVAGAYWRGNERNPQLQRIYGTAWPSQKELDAYLEKLKEIERRDHRRDRKSTRLNSSHVANSYAVFCLKKTNTRLNSGDRENSRTIVLKTFLFGVILLITI